MMTAHRHACRQMRCWRLLAIQYGGTQLTRIKGDERSQWTDRRQQPQRMQRTHGSGPHHKGKPNG